MSWRRMILAAAVVAVPSYAGAQDLDYGVFKASVGPIFITKRDGYSRCVVCHAGANNALRLERPGPQWLHRGAVEEELRDCVASGGARKAG